MAGSIRCPKCGGLNPAGAQWCGQCLERFVARTPPPPPPPPVGAIEEVVGDPAGSPPQKAAAQGVVQQRGAFLVSDEGISWKCSRCETNNPLEATVCSVCGTTFATSMNPPEERPDRDPNTVAMYSLFFPGAGHWHLGMKGAAVARGVLSVWVVLVAIAAAVAGSATVATVFGIAAFALWAIAAHDAFREAQGAPGSVILKSRVFLYVVLALLMLMIIMLVSTGLRAAR